MNATVHVAVVALHASWLHERGDQPAPGGALDEHGEGGVEALGGPVGAVAVQLEEAVDEEEGGLTVLLWTRLPGWRSTVG